MIMLLRYITYAIPTWYKGMPLHKPLFKLTSSDATSVGDNLP